MEHQHTESLKEGMKVEILTSQNRLSTGFVDSIATRVQFHPDGIMVRLTNGEVGRVKKIILSLPEENEKKAGELKKILERGEDIHLECKSSALWSTILSHAELKQSSSFELREYGNRASKIILAKSIASFLNSDGGLLLIGIKERKESGKFEITGIEEDLKKLKEPTTDAYKRILIDEIIRTFFPPKLFNHLDSYINIEFINLEKTICQLKIKRSDSRIFLKINDKDVFMIRINSENRVLEGEKLVDYCIKHWGIRQ